MKKEDLDQVLEIEQASFSVPWSKNLFLSEFRSPRIATLMVALAETPVRTVIGYIIFWVVEDETHILNLAVAQRYRGEGVAKQLVLAGLQHASQKGGKRAFLEVRASNIPAQRLYSSLGFLGTGIRKDYYEMPEEDAIIMTLEQSSFLLCKDKKVNEIDE